MLGLALAPDVVAVQVVVDPPPVLLGLPDASLQVGPGCEGGVSLVIHTFVDPKTFLHCEHVSKHPGVRP